MRKDFMKAAVLSAPGELVISDSVPKPVVADQNQVLVKIACTAVCGTDVSIYRGKIKPPEYPVIQGHESAGTVCEIGKNVRSVKPGDRVVLNPALSCGKCCYCLKGNTNLCVNGGLLGRDANGTFAEYAIVPEVGAIKLTKPISFEDASTLNAVASVLRGWDHLHVFPGETVAVIGLGTTGLIHARIAVLSGASKVFGITRSNWKLDIAEKYGAIPMGGDGASIRERVMDQTNSSGIDVVIDTVCSQQTIAQAMDLVCMGGTILLFGINAVINELNIYEVYRKELKILGSRAMNRDGYERAVELYNNGMIDLSLLITHRFELEQLKDMFEAAYHTPSASLRMVCRISEK